MASFIKKSMAVSEYDHCHGSFVYTVHDILLDYLKNLLKEDPASEKVNISSLQTLDIFIKCPAQGSHTGDFGYFYKIPSAVITYTQGS